jgi:hypothetical protein
VSNDSNVKPRFIHDCEQCVFLGQDEEHDFYFCPSPSGFHTVIARFGSDGPDYASGLEIAEAVEKREGPNSAYSLVKALKLARERGLVSPPVTAPPKSVWWVRGVSSVGFMHPHLPAKR